MITDDALGRRTTRVGYRGWREVALGASLVAAGCAGAASAQTLGAAVQDLQVEAGWNAVLLRVDAPLEERIELLEGAAVSRILIRSVDDESSPGRVGEMLARDDWPEASIWAGREIDTDDSESVRAAAEALAAGRCYLLSAGSGRNVRLTGAPTARAQSWRGAAGALIAGHGDPAVETTVGAYFGASPAYRDADYHAVTPGGAWGRIAPDETPLEADRCLFVRVRGASDYRGPVEAVAPTSEGLVFSGSGAEQDLRLVNRTGETATVTLSTPSIDGNPALFRWREDEAARLVSQSAGQAFEAAVLWSAIDDVGITVDVPPRSMRFLRLGANFPAALEWRNRPAQAGEPEGAEGFVRSVLSVRGAGVRYELPVAIDVGPPAAAAEAAALTGLWVGDVSVERVSEDDREGLDPVPVATPFLFRLIVHKDRSGACRILSDAIAMQAADGSRRYVLTDEETARERVRAGARFLWRESSVAYVTDGAVTAEAAVDDGEHGCLSAGSSVTFRLVLAYDHPLHPDVHGAHPDHDNLDERYAEKLPPGVESETIERVLTLSVADSRSWREYAVDWSPERITGGFSEVISGIHRYELGHGGALLPASCV